MIGPFRRSKRQGAQAPSSEHLTSNSSAGKTTSGIGMASGLPAGREISAAAHTQTPTRLRSRARKRARYLRQLQELLLRDLGGFFFEIHRHGGGLEHLDRYARVTEAKLARMSAVEAEMQGLRSLLGEPTNQLVLRQPGIGGLCPSCQEPFASQAKFCSFCGLPLRGAVARDIRPALSANSGALIRGSKARESIGQTTQPMDAVAAPQVDAMAEPAQTSSQGPVTTVAEDPESVTRRIQPAEAVTEMPRAHKSSGEGKFPTAKEKRVKHSDRGHDRS